MTPEELDRRYGPEPDETALAREAVEDRAADHTPADLRSRQGSTSTPPSADGAPHQRPPSRGRAAISPADSAPASREDREAAPEPSTARTANGRDLLRHERKVRPAPKTAKPKPTKREE